MAVIQPSLEERLRKGYEFQDYVKWLLSKSGYLEGQIYSTGSSLRVDYGKRLAKLKKQAYTSPDVLIANKWMNSSPEVEYRFGISCSRRDSLFQVDNDLYATLPYYQRKNLVEMSQAKKLHVYLAFGTLRRRKWFVGITKLRDPERSYVPLVDQSTGKERYNDLYSVKRLQRWRQFLAHRRQVGDQEPDFRFLKTLRFGWIGSVKERQPA